MSWFKKKAAKVDPAILEEQKREEQLGNLRMTQGEIHSQVSSLEASIAKAEAQVKSYNEEAKAMLRANNTKLAAIKLKQAKNAENQVKVLSNSLLALSKNSSMLENQISNMSQLKVLKEVNKTFVTNTGGETIAEDLMDAVQENQEAIMQMDQMNEMIAGITEDPEDADEVNDALAALQAEVAYEKANGLNIPEAAHAEPVVSEPQKAKPTAVTDKDMYDNLL